MYHVLRNTGKNIALPFLSIIFALIFITLSPIDTSAAKDVKQTYNPSYGVQYQKLDYNSKSNVDVMEVDISEPFTEVQLGVPNPLDDLQTVRRRANTYDTKNNDVIGAINANFYKVNPGWNDTTRPVHLISKDNRLVNKGWVNDSSYNMINEPIAFGIDKAGNGLIDHYDLNLTYTFNGKDYKISHTNRKRASNNTILYTSDFYKNNTDTNQYGTELVLKGPKNVELTLGSTKAFQVNAIREEGDQKPTEISDDAIVLSGNGKGSKKLQKVDVGDTVKINTAIDEKWQGSDFMLAGGPQLVKNGQVNISMNTDAGAAQSLTSRTAVGVNETNGKVFFVTADTKIECDDCNNGMTIPQLASVMKDLGADAALNLDGGGSTTMAVRPENGGALKIANKLQDGAERAVSGILMAADTVPDQRIFKDVSYRFSGHYEGIQWAKDNGSIEGYRDNTFKPDQDLSRQHSAVIFTRAFNLDKPGTNKAHELFNDIKAYSQEIGAVAQSDIFRGSLDDKFKPRANMTRQQMASTIVRAFDLKSTSEHANVPWDQNFDKAHRKNVQILADLGITDQLGEQGEEDYFRPRDAVTRGQFASFLHRASQVQ